MPFTKRHRHLVPEQMDADDVDPRELARALAFIRRINALLRYNANVVRAVGEEIGRIGSSQSPITVLDVAAGSGDLLVDLHAWSQPRGKTLQMIGLDRHATTIAEGVSAASGAGVRFIRADALALPF